MKETSTHQEVLSLMRPEVSRRPSHHNYNPFTTRSSRPSGGATTKYHADKVATQSLKTYHLPSMTTEGTFITTASHDASPKVGTSGLTEAQINHIWNMR
jgi:hypothetical protein